MVEVICYVQDSFYVGLLDCLLWCDGLGLFWYNFFMFWMMVGVFDFIWQEKFVVWCYSVFFVGGVLGIIEDFYVNSQGEFYVFVKIGILSNKYCLSGYLLIVFGWEFIFSFMYNNYV